MTIAATSMATACIPGSRVLTGSMRDGSRSGEFQWLLPHVSPYGPRAASDSVLPDGVTQRGSHANGAPMSSPEAQAREIVSAWLEMQREGWTHHHCQHGTTCAESFNVAGVDN